MPTIHPKISILVFLLLISGALNCQSQYTIAISNTPDECANGRASVTINGDSSEVAVKSWSNGQGNVSSITDLVAGDYSVNIKIPSKLDTTLYFTIEKKMCPVSVPSFFSPNSDGHNDLFYITNVSNYPNFEFQVFNKWGQRVHAQQSAFVPWDGNSAGIGVPDGTYYYVFFFDASDKKKLLKGDITILR